jgi:hypothetical protein
MWYGSQMAATVTHTELESARAAVRNAVNVRNHHKRRTRKGDPQREADIAVALDRLKEAMRPLRSAIGKFPGEPQTEALEPHRAEIRDLSRQIQGQRRRLWKMQLHERKDA